MIYVDRSEVAMPTVLENYQESKEYQAAATFFGVPEDEREQRRFAFKLYKHAAVREALNELFHGKCAYCEIKYGAIVPVDVEHYRPKAGVSESSKHPGYWWLAGAWDNLLTTCIDCNRSRVQVGGTKEDRLAVGGKGNRFPLVDEEKRAFKPGEEEREEPLLLNPCTDRPAEHLVFHASGEVFSDTPKGKTTIAVLGLNRPQLVRNRAEAVKRVLALLRKIESLVRVPVRDLPPGEHRSEIEKRLAQYFAELRRLMEPEQEFAGLNRQLIQTRLAEIEGAPTAPEPKVEIAPERRERAKASYEEYQRQQADYSLETEEGRQKYRSQTRYIETIVLHNIKAIHELRLDLTRSQASSAPWLTLLGENATGKSTVLQSVALTLGGVKTILNLYFKFGFRPVDYIRTGAEDGRGSIEVKVSGFPKPHKLTLHERWVEFESPLGKKTKVRTDWLSLNHPRWAFSSAAAQHLLLGYGATRLLPRRGLRRWLGRLITEGHFGFPWTRIDNLFHPFVALADAQDWLVSLPSTQFRRTALVLKDLLGLGPEHTLVKEEGKIKVEIHGSSVPLSKLSDGYQSTVAVTVDILKATYEVWKNPDAAAEGIVLLDEVGAHLHPRWKMRIVSSLRQALPGFQFLATTHEPLCLRGLAPGEMIVLRRDDNNKIIQIDDLPDPSAYRVDQLLTSRFFGLLTTHDPDFERLFIEYSALVARRRKGALEREEEMRYQYLKVKLKDRGHLGDSLREELMYEVIDELLARQRPETPPDTESLVQEAAASTREIWAELLDFSRPDADADEKA